MSTLNRGGADARPLASKAGIVPEIGGLLLLTPSDGFGGGIERVAAAVARSWPRRVLRVNLYDAQEVEDPRGNPMAKVRFTARALRLAALAQPSHVLALHVGFLPVAVAAARIARARPSLLGIGVEIWGAQPRLRRTLARRAQLLSISGFTADRMATTLDVPRHRVTVLPLPIEPLFAQLAHEPAPPRDAAVMTAVTVTRLTREHRYKGCFDIVRAMAEPAVRTAGVRWRVVGHGDDLPELERAVREAGLQGVELLGNISDLELVNVYRGSDLLVLPSVTDADADPPIGEGFGLVYAEAGSLAVPSIASRAGGGALDFVKDGVTGRLVKVDDTASLAGAILEMADNPSLRRRLGSAARDRVLQYHLPEQFADGLVAQLSDQGRQRS